MERPRLALPLEYLPRYLCPHCEALGHVRELRYDSETHPDTHETGASCESCGTRWVITATANGLHPETMQRGSFDFQMREVTD